MHISLKHPACQLILGLGVIAITLFPAFAPIAAEQIFCSSIWYIIGLSVAYFIFSSLPLWKESFVSIKSDARGVGICFALVLVVLVPGFSQLTIKPRIFDDEINLALSARAFVETHQPRYPVESFSGTDTRSALHTEWDVRPFLQPFLVSGLHLVFGADLRNVFILNGILFSSILLFVVIFFRRLFGSVLAGAIALLFSVSQPVLFLYAASGTFDMLALSLMVVATVSLSRFVSQPNSETRRFLLASLILLAHSRFESILYAAVTLGCFALNKDWREKLRLSIGEGIICFAAFLPLIWQRILKRESPVLPPGTALFSISSAIENNRAILQSLWRTDSLFPFLPPILIFGLFCTVWQIGRRVMPGALQSSPSAKIFWRVLGANAFAYWGVITFHFWSRIDDPLVERHYLPMALSLSVCAAWGILAGLKDNSRLLAFAFMASLVLAFSGIQRTGERSAYDIGAYAFRFGVMKEFLGSESSKKLLIIGGSPRQYLALGYPGVEFSSADVHREQISRGLENHEWDAVYLVQNFSKTRGMVLPAEDLKGFALETVREVDYPDRAFLPKARTLRISRVVDN